MKNLTLIDVENREENDHKFREPKQLNHHEDGVNYGGSLHYQQQHENIDGHGSSAYYGYGVRDHEYYSQGFINQEEPMKRRDLPFDAGNGSGNYHNSAQDFGYTSHHHHHDENRDGGGTNYHDYDTPQTSYYPEENGQPLEVKQPKPSPTYSQDSGHCSPNPRSCFIPSESHQLQNYDHEHASAKYGGVQRSNMANPNGRVGSSGSIPTELVTPGDHYRGQIGPNAPQGDYSHPHANYQDGYNSRNMMKNTVEGDYSPQKSGRSVDPSSAGNSHHSLRSENSYDRNLVVHATGSTSDKVVLYSQPGDGVTASQAHRQQQNPDDNRVDRHDRRQLKPPSRSVRDTVKSYDFGEQQQRSLSSPQSSNRSSITSISSVESGNSQNRYPQQRDHKVNPAGKTRNSTGPLDPHHQQQHRGAKDPSRDHHPRLPKLQTGKAAADSRPRLSQGHQPPHHHHQTLSQHYDNAVNREQMKQGQPQFYAANLTPAKIERSSSSGQQGTIKVANSREMVQRKSGKAVVKNPLLKYDVIPPKKHGPTSAEQKLEELTRQLELEMEENPDGEEFGKACNNLSYFLNFFFSIFGSLLVPYRRTAST